jgi:hypothetical protein
MDQYIDSDGQVIMLTQESKMDRFIEIENGDVCARLHSVLTSKRSPLLTCKSYYCVMQHCTFLSGVISIRLEGLLHQRMETKQSTIRHGSSSHGQFLAQRTHLGSTFPFLFLLAHREELDSISILHSPFHM